MRRLQWISTVVLVLAGLPACAADLAVLHNGFSISHERREVIGNTTRLYLSNGSGGYVDVLSSQIDHFEKDTAPATVPTSVAASTAKPAPRLGDVVADASGRYHLDPDLVNSVIRAESGFNARAVSPKGAQGLMQLMPQTASKLGVGNAFDPQANVQGGTQYLRALLERYNFDLIKALAAYNAGPKRVEQYGGLPPYYETQAYVARIIRDFNRKKLAEQKSAASKPKLKALPQPVRTASASAVPQRASQ